MEVQFACFTKDEEAAVWRILRRAADIVAKHGDELDQESLRMDLAAVHHHTPLCLVELAFADDFNFVHDVFGIRNHIDRETGQLTEYFRPRFAK